MDGPAVGDIYQKHFNGRRRERLFLSSISFFVTFGITRGITHAIRRHIGPFHDIERPGLHLHHLVWGIFSLLGVGYLWLAEVGTGMEGTSSRTSRATSLLYGGGAALTLDEFALWLHLEDVYGTKQGRDSIDAVVLFAAMLSIGWWGGPFFHELTRETARVLKRNVTGQD
ncbi:MAG TPA: hypothetical protein VFN57_13090 [Thermomicrobiaceae bacterium]|nr:hypothetical protein [Thermomicrobiaceae bacterium]